MILDLELIEGHQKKKPVAAKLVFAPQRSGQFCNIYRGVNCFFFFCKLYLKKKEGEKERKEGRKKEKGKERKGLGISKPYMSVETVF